MRKLWLIVGLAGATFLVSCDQPMSPSPGESLTVTEADAARLRDIDLDEWRLAATLSGVGTVDLSSANAGTMQFIYAASVLANGKASGLFWQRRETAGGTVEFTGLVTCLTFDPVNRRAWVAGRILVNKSTDPAARVDTLHKPGMDIWFRVVDYAAASPPETDRSTVFGFRGSAGIITSADYCATKPWPETPTRDARTFPASQGDLKLRTP